MRDANGEERRGWVLTGRVQGVGFRWWTTRTARSLGLRGTVRNRRDGAVEIHAAGPAAALRELGERLREGPPAARVGSLEQVPADSSLPENFQIIR